MNAASILLPWLHNSRSSLYHPMPRAAYNNQPLTELYCDHFVNRHRTPGVSKAERNLVNDVLTLMTYSTYLT